MRSALRAAAHFASAPLAAALLGCVLLASAPARADVPAHLERAIGDARSAGSGRLTWFGLHVYDARLFVPAAGFDSRRYAEQPFALELTYARRLSGRAIAERSDAEIARMGLGSAEQRTRWLQAMVALFPDVEAGQRLAGINVPGRGTEFHLDGRTLGRIDDPAFGPAFFAIWLDARTTAPDLRASLLKQAR
jgi:hypothetical protein